MSVLFALLLVSAPQPQVPAVAEPSARADHLALHVADVDRSVAFYKRTFGLAELAAPVSGPRWLSLGGTMALHIIGGRIAPVPTDKYVHFAISVRDFAGLIARLKADEVTYGDFPGTAGTINRVRSDGAQQIFLQDPDGYWIEVNDLLETTGR